MNTPKISIVMPTKDRASFLPETINSYLAQTFQDWELIIVDDHSSDETKEIIDGFKDARIKYYSLTETTGIANARNFGNHQAQGEIIVVADSDDIAYPQRLEITWDFFEKNLDYSIFYTNIDLYWPETKKIETRWFQPFKADILHQINFIPNPAASYRKSAFLKTPGYDPAFLIGEDYDLWLTFLEQGCQFGYTSQTLVKMTKHSESIRQEKAELHHQNINQIRQKHNIKIIKPEKLKPIIEPLVYQYFTTPEKYNLWFN